MIAKPLFTLFFIAGLTTLPISAEDIPLASLEEVSKNFVTAYNAKNVEAISSLYTEEAELVDEIDANIASGRDGIRDFYQASFTTAPERKVSLEVLSVRQLAGKVVVEDGLASFSGNTEEEEGSVVSYSAILVQNEEGKWLIASSRELATQTIDVDPLDELQPLIGDWTFQGDQMQMEISLDFSDSGRFIVGDALTTTPSDGAIATEIRIGYDADRKEIRWWTFDELGGFAGGAWQPLESSWLVRSNGVTAAGETTAALQELTFEGENTIVWNSTRRFLNGSALPDLELRLVRRPPAPAAASLAPETTTAP